MTPTETLNELIEWYNNNQKMFRGGQKHLRLETSNNGQSLMLVNQNNSLLAIHPALKQSTPPTEEEKAKQILFHIFSSGILNSEELIKLFNERSMTFKNGNTE